MCLFAPLAGAADDSGSCVVSMSATLDSAVLIATDTSEETVVSSPVPLVFVGDEGKLKAVVTITPTSGATTFTDVRISLSNISFTLFQAGGLTPLAGNPSSLVNLVVEFEEEDEDDDLEEITPGQPVSLELEFEVEDGLQPDGAGCFTGDFLADPAAAFEAELEDDANEEEELEFAGEVVSVGASDFVLDVAGTELTIAVDGNTQFEDITGLSDLAMGDLVKAEVEVQFDGTLLAEEVELLFDEDDQDGVTGRIAGVDPSTGPATSVQLVFAPSSPDHDFPAVTVQVNVLGGTTFKVNRGRIRLNGLTFDDSNLAVGQRVTAAGTPFTGGTAPELDAGRLILKQQKFLGMVVDGSVDTAAGTFQLNVTSASDVLLSGPLTVRVNNRTRFAGRLRGLNNLNTTATYLVRGLLLRNGADATEVILLAKKVKKLRRRRRGR